MSEAYWEQLRANAKAALSDADYLEAAAEEQAESESEEISDFEERYEGEYVSVGYPDGSPEVVIKWDFLPDRVPIRLAGGPEYDWSSERGRHQVAVLLLLHDDLR